MKRFFRIALALMTAFAMLLAAGCGGENESVADEPSSSLDFGDDVTYIDDASYYNYYLEFTGNASEYNGKKFAVDGMFHVTKLEDSEMTQLFRYHREIDPADGKEYAYYRGFMLKGDNAPKDLPEKTWIRVIGTLELQKHEDHSHAFLIVDSYEVLDVPGSEYVE